MKKSNTKTKLLALAMAVVVAGGSLTGCSKEVSGTKTVMDKDHVYKAEYIEVPEEITSINRMKAGKERIYMDGYNEKQGYSYRMVSMKPDGTDMKVIYEQKPEEQSNVTAFAPDSEGNLCYLKQVYEEDKSDPENIQYTNKYFLVKADLEGKEVLNIELKGEKDLNVNDILVDKDGNVIMVCYDSMKVFDKDGKSKASVETGGSYIDSTFLTEAGKIYTTSYSQDYSKREVKEFLPNEKKFSEPIEMELSGYTNYTFFPGVGYDMLMKDNTDLYGYNIETKEKTKLVNWIDSDINGTMVNSLIQLSDGKIAFVSNNYMKTPSTSELAIMTKVAPEDVVEKTVLTLASVYTDMRVSSAVIDFNKKSDKYRITIKDYSVYNTDDDYMAGSNKLNTDIISGNVPDLLSVNDTSSFQSFVSKGLLMDINELMKEDKDFNRSDYLENIFAAFEDDGKMYSLVPFFQTFSIVGKTSNVGKEMGWTMEDMQKLIDSKPKGTKLFENMTQSQIMYYGNYLCLESYVDYKKGTSNFDTQEFKELMEFAKQFPKEMENMEDGGIARESAVAIDSGSYENQETMYKKDKVLLQENYLYGFEEIHRLQKVTFGEEITFIGFPTANKNGSAISPGLQISISSKTASKEAAWEFVKSFLSDSFQDDLSWGWPTKLSSIEKKKEKEQKPQTYTDENGKEVEYEETYTENGKEVKLGTVTDEECEKVMEFIKSLSQVMQYDQKIAEIIDEESAAFFADQKSVDEAAKLIQNRVQTYLAEKQ